MLLCSFGYVPAWLRPTHLSTINQFPVLLSFTIVICNRKKKIFLLIVSWMKGLFRLLMIAAVGLPSDFLEKFQMGLKVMYIILPSVVCSSGKYDLFVQIFINAKIFGETQHKLFFTFLFLFSFCWIKCTHWGNKKTKIWLWHNCATLEGHQTINSNHRGTIRNIVRVTRSWMDILLINFLSCMIWGQNRAH